MFWPGMKNRSCAEGQVRSCTESRVRSCRALDMFWPEQAGHVMQVRLLHVLKVRSCTEGQVRSCSGQVRAGLC